MQIGYTKFSNLHTKTDTSLEGGEKVQKVVAEQVDVIAHAAVRPLRIMSENRLHDRLMLAHSVGDPVRHARHAAAISCHLIAQPSGLIGEIDIARGFVDRLMEFLIDVVKHVDVAGLSSSHKTLMNP